jgi:hypothetical protein
VLVADREGWLWKQGGRYKTWKRRWFILNDNCLYYFEFTTDKACSILLIKLIKYFFPRTIHPFYEI